MKNIQINIKDILEEYKPDNDIMSEEDSKINNLKNIIYNKLDEVDRRIILMYAETGSLRKLGKELGVCATTAQSKINEIRRKIYDYNKPPSHSTDNSIHN